MQIDQRFIKRIGEIAATAGEAIMQIYRKQEIEVTLKSDKSPVTQADMAAHQIIVDQLGEFGIPVLSEESNEQVFKSRHQWRRYFLVDPLDGTKEFINRHGDFTVNIALIEGDRAAFGWVLKPTTQSLFYGGSGIGAWCQHGSEDPAKIRVAQLGDHWRLAASRSHRTPSLERFIESLEQDAAVEAIEVGSALKLCMVAAGECDIYPRFSPTYEWDTAAGQAIVEGAGGTLQTMSGERFRYNRKDLKNGNFLALGQVTPDQRRFLQKMANYHS